MNEFQKIYSQIYNKNGAMISYSQFESLLIKYSESIMKFFAKDATACKCLIKNLSKRGTAEYDENNNVYIIKIDESIVKKIYSGSDTLAIFTIFHEISHIFDMYKINANEFRDLNQNRVCKEEAILSSLPRRRSKSIIQR